MVGSRDVLSMRAQKDSCVGMSMCECRAFSLKWWPRDPQLSPFLRGEEAAGRASFQAKP